MNSKRLTLLLVAVTIVVGVDVLVYYLLTSRNDADPTAQDTGGRRVLYWRDPMDPTMTSDKPGKSPMGMDMVPVYEGEQGSGVKIDPTTLQNIGVRYETAEIRSLKRNTVCGMIIDTDAAAGKSDYEGVTYYFCAPGCKKAFDRDPKKYLERNEPHQARPTES